MRVIAALLLFLAGANNPGVAETDPCAKYTDADAYNYCLAASGPVARHRAYSSAPERAPSPELRRHSRSAPAARVSARHFPPGMIQKPAPNGRVRFQIMLR